ncbi:MAG: methionyl-tRNA formyltransferase [Candidatus Saccharibacteria bacterium]|nr:methionyl-tRNA formyltransferase [Candidatus Saccharibacteria bacterium]
MTKVIYFGNERLVSGLEKTDAPVLRGLIEKGYDVVAVVSHHAGSHSRTQRNLEVADIATSHNIPIFLPNRPLEIIENLRSLHADIAVLAAYGRIISQEVIDVFPLGIVNIHPSLLPKYRGPTPIESAILHGDTKTGISIMQLTAGMDEGPVYAQAIVPINEFEKKFDLYDTLVNVSTDLFFNTFPAIINGSLEPKSQSTDGISYSNLIQKSDSIIDWNKSAVQIEREIRAYEKWPQSRTKLGSAEVIITEAHTLPATINELGRIEINDEDNSLMIYTKDGILSIDTVKPLGKKEMPVKAFLAGYRSQLNI